MRNYEDKTYECANIHIDISYYFVQFNTDLCQYFGIYICGCFSLEYQYQEEQ